MRTRTLQQMVTFKASPHQVYDILMNSKKHQSLSGEPAKISRKVGGKFTAWGSHISGINLVLKPGKKSCKHGVPQDGGRITTRSRSMTSPRFRAGPSLSSPRLASHLIATVAITVDGLKPTGRQ